MKAKTEQAAAVEQAPGQPVVMSVKDMRKAIEGGQSVSYGGRIITDVRDLPTEAEAATNPHEMAQAVAALEKQRDALNVQIQQARGRMDSLANERQAGDARATQVSDDPGRPTTMAGGPGLRPGEFGTGGPALTRGQQDSARDKATKSGHAPAVGEATTATTGKVGKSKGKSGKGGKGHTGGAGEYASPEGRSAAEAKDDAKRDSAP